MITALRGSGCQETFQGMAGSSPWERICKNCPGGWELMRAWPWPVVLLWAPALALHIHRALASEPTHGCSFAIGASPTPHLAMPRWGGGWLCCPGKVPPILCTSSGFRVTQGCSPAGSFGPYGVRARPRALALHAAAWAPPSRALGCALGSRHFPLNFHEKET